MNNYLFYSEINRKIVSIMAEDYNHSLELLRKCTRNDVKKNDYVLVNSETYKESTSFYIIPPEM